jgi:hypothetical protein
MAEQAEFTVQVQWHSPDRVYAAGFLRDGEPWILDGALVGMGSSRSAAVAELEAAARHLALRGGNFMTGGQIEPADREWLFAMLAAGPFDEELDDARAAARKAGG